MCALSSHCYSVLFALLLTWVQKGSHLNTIIYMFNVMCTVLFNLCLHVYYHSVHTLFIILCPGCCKCCSWSSSVSTSNWGNNSRFKHWWFFSPSSSMYGCLCLTASYYLFTLQGDERRELMVPSYGSLVRNCQWNVCMYIWHSTVLLYGQPITILLLTQHLSVSL